MTAFAILAMFRNDRSTKLLLMKLYMSTMILGAWRMRKVTTMLRRIRNKFSSFFNFFFDPNL